MDYQLTIQRSFIKSFQKKKKLVRSGFWFLNNLNNKVQEQFTQSEISDIKDALYTLDRYIQPSKYNYLITVCKDILLFIERMLIIRGTSKTEKIFHTCLLQTLTISPQKNLASIMAYYSIVDYFMMIIELNLGNNNAQIEQALIHKADSVLKHSLVNDLRIFIKLRSIVQSPLQLAIKSLLDISINFFQAVLCHKYTNPSLLNGICYADLAYTVFEGNNISKKTFSLQKYSLRVAGKLINGKFSFPNGLCGFIAFDNNQQELIMGFRGSKNLKNWITNFQQLLLRANIVYKMALGLLLYLLQSAEGKQISVYGHSLGGGLMQFAVLGASSSFVRGYGYNSAGLSSCTIDLLQQPMKTKYINHLYQPNDIVFSIGTQFGCEYRIQITENCPIKAHSLDTMRKNCNQNTYYKLS